jgi:hypothetical protein
MQETYELCFRNPTTSPTTNPTMHSRTINAMIANVFQPPLLAICLLSFSPFLILSSSSFSPCGPSTPVPSNGLAYRLYCGGLLSYCIGGACSPNALLGGRFDARGGTGGVSPGAAKESRSSAMTGKEEEVVRFRLY